MLRLFQESGLRYLSSQLWGPDHSLPAPLNQPFNYAADGFPELWEIPGHGWHENLLKNHNHWGPKRLTLWPPIMPEAVPPGFLAKPEDEFAVNRVFLEQAAAKNLTFVSLVWHPWSLEKFDPEVRMLDLTFKHAQSLGLKPCTYADLYRQLAGH